MLKSIQIFVYVFGIGSLSYSQQRNCLLVVTLSTDSVDSCVYVPVECNDYFIYQIASDNGFDLNQEFNDKELDDCTDCNDIQYINQISFLETYTFLNGNFDSLVVYNSIKDLSSVCSISPFPVPCYEVIKSSSIVLGIEDFKNARILGYKQILVPNYNVLTKLEPEDSVLLGKDYRLEHITKEFTPDRVLSFFMFEPVKKQAYILIKEFETFYKSRKYLLQDGEEELEHLLSKLKIEGVIVIEGYNLN